MSGRQVQVPAEALEELLNPTSGKCPDCRCVMHVEAHAEHCAVPALQAALAAPGDAPNSGSKEAAPQPGVRDALLAIKAYCRAWGSEANWEEVVKLADAALARLDMRDQEIEDEAEYRLIPLTGKAGAGLWAIVDAENYERLRPYSWHCAVMGHNTKLYYARRGRIKNDPAPGTGSMVYMHRQIIPVENDLFIDHINGNGLDNRAKNLRVVTPAENTLNKRPYVFSKRMS